MIINPNEMMRKTSNSKGKKKGKKVSKRKRKKLTRKEKLAKKI